MELGLVLQPDPPASEAVALMRRAEDNGFTHGWLFDSCVLWQEAYLVLGRILAETRTLTVGPMVTNPLTRDWSVTASLFATLNDMYGTRTVCGIGRGDSAVRFTGGRPGTLARLEHAITAIRALTAGEEVDLDGTPVRIPWVREGRPPVWMAAYGPRALGVAGRVADGLIIQLADPYLVRWMTRSFLDAAEEAGRDPSRLAVCVAAPAYVCAPGDLAHAREQCRWFGGMVGNHVADLVARYGEHSTAVPEALTAYIRTRGTYDYAHHGRAGNASTDFVPDDVVDRFCLLGPIEEHADRLSELAALGVTQFAMYGMHDAVPGAIDAYGRAFGAGLPGVNREIS